MNNPLHSRNRNFPLNHVHNAVKVTNLALYLERNWIWFTKPDMSFKSENWKQLFRHYFRLCFNVSTVK